MGDNPAIGAAPTGPARSRCWACPPSDGPGSLLEASPESGIETLEDLEGKRVAFTTGTAQHGLALRALDSVGLGQSDVTQVDVPLQDLPSVLESGDADASVISYEAEVKYERAHPDAVRLVSAADLPGAGGFHLVADAALEDPGTAAAVYDYFERRVRAQQWIVDNPDIWLEEFYVKERHQTPRTPRSSSRARATRRSSRSPRTCRPTTSTSPTCCSRRVGCRRRSTSRSSTLRRRGPLQRGPRRDHWLTPARATVPTRPPQEEPMTTLETAPPHRRPTDRRPGGRRRLGAGRGAIADRCDRPSGRGAPDPRPHRRPDDRPPPRRSRIRGRCVASPALLIVVVWHLLSTTGVLSERVMAPPGDVLQAALDLIETGELQHHLLTSLRRVVTGLAIGVSAGVLLATVSGLFRLGEDLVDSTMQVLRAVPTLGLIPLVIIWFGIGEQPKILLVAIGTTFPSTSTPTPASAGRRQAGRGRHDVRPGSLGAGAAGRPARSRARLPRRPALRPHGAWLIMIVAEQINARSGLGFLINEARSWYRTDIIVMGLVVYGLLGLAADGIVRFLERTLLAWRRGFTGT